MCLFKMLLQYTLEIPMHLKLENHCFGRQMCQQVTTLWIVIRAKEVEKYCRGFCKIEVGASSILWHITITYRALYNTRALAI